ncbi:type IV toxin-antitoxin system AbiEi family antitoxin domain-containing protein [Deinococcus cellulosilyticus]|uniref:type IV toxin-antitoxin system AbiEi family antitoxin domain-containing protein n=1 Tax=Deinococcus cellulosilyticus TaxID=401558 RepID=UPI0011BEA8B7
MNLQQYAEENDTPVVTRQTLTKLGYHHRHIQKAMQAGELKRLRPGYYRILKTVFCPMRSCRKYVPR